MAENRPCPFCGGTKIWIKAGGQNWRGVKGWSDPQWFQLIHNGVLDRGDGVFETCTIQLRARTGPGALAAWEGE